MRTTASNVIESWVWKSMEYRYRTAPASTPPATPVTNDASAKAQSL